MAIQNLVRQPGKPDDYPLQLVRPREAAARLGVSTNTIYNWCRSGVLGSVRIGRSVRIPVTELEAFVERGRQWN
jgi:excisionase family DNA binding protein